LAVPHQRLATHLPDLDAQALGQGIREHETSIVAVRGMLSARIPEADQQ
jgi:hypothetical protein